jgi:hypothetical protein
MEARRKRCAGSSHRLDVLPSHATARSMQEVGACLMTETASVASSDRTATNRHAPVGSDIVSLTCNTYRSRGKRIEALCDRM